jgi:hypothetical protein
MSDVDHRELADAMDGAARALRRLGFNVRNAREKVQALDALLQPWAMPDFADPGAPWRA